VTPEIEALITDAAGARPLRFSALSGGCIGDVSRVEMSDGSNLVAKLGGADSGLAREGFMLEYLAEHSPLPVPRVLHADDNLLLMQELANDGRINTAAEQHAADLVAALHDVTGPAFGFEGDTVIGGLNQPNPPDPSWLNFFRDQRLLGMGRRSYEAGRLPTATFARLETLAARLGQWIEEPQVPSLVHGDMWGGNVLSYQGRITGFIDPAIYYADAEIELAFTTLFNTFGDRFFARYQEHRPLMPGFFEVRRDLYNLYPLLVHVRLFGGSYIGAVERTLTRFEC
jgi:fructosamine-3-kinase